MFEIERKFLVKSSEWQKDVVGSTSMRQFYLSDTKNPTIRVRIEGVKAILTIKKDLEGPQGFKRLEWEKEMPIEVATELEELSGGRNIEKTRFYVEHDHDGDTYLFEVDVFSGNNEGLTTVEIELDSEDSFFPVPEWLGEEVTGQSKYLNGALVKNPFSDWD